ncbi:MAG: enoyl-CoA hydratase/isomerase family protein [Candidatus Methanofastidiosia archaeon]|jgi:enoyl-CoA hydratase/carnithine racemase
MDLIHIEYKDDVAVIKLANTVTNPINLQLVTELKEGLQTIQKDSMGSVVLSSSNSKFFSIGLDIPSLYDLSKKDFAVFYKRFNRMCIDLYTLPIPTVASVTGHAVAGGCILAVCCDYRVIAEGKKLMGLNEVKLGVPIPYPADCILRSLVGGRIARDIVDTGKFYPPEILLQMGLVDCVVPLPDVLPKSIEMAKVLGGLPRKAFAIIKRSRIEGIEEQILQKLEEKEQFFMECWFSKEGRNRLKDAMKKF